MKTLELKAASLDEAIKLAAAEWGASADQIEVTVLDELKGLFGKPNVLTVRATMAGGEEEAPAAAPAPAPAPKRAPRRAKAEEVKEEAPQAEAEEESEDEPKEERRPRRSARTRRVKAEEGSEAEAPAAEADAEDKPARPARSARGRREVDPNEPEPVATEEDGQELADVLNSLIAESGLKAKAKCARVQGRYVHLELSGKEAGFLVGRRGEVLNSLQSVMNIIAGRRLESGVRVVLDGDGFRDRRRSVLEKQARDIAAEVLERGEEAVLDSLPAFERRVIHQVLSEIEGIRTYSEGEEPHRSVVIAPAD